MSRVTLNAWSNATVKRGGEGIDLDIEKGVRRPVSGRRCGKTTTLCMIAG